LNHDFDETYEYDAIDRLISSTRADDFDQSWTLDGLGNFAEFDDDGQTQTRSANAVNEITAITGGSITPAYDTAGNMIAGPRPGDETTRVHYAYDAWNRLAKVYADNSGEPGDLIAAYEYDGTKRRIEKVVTAEGGGAAHVHYFYNHDWQLLEERFVDEQDELLASNQYVWSPRYIDAPIVRFHDANGDGDYVDEGDNIRFYTGDANFNVTAIVDAATGNIVERYVYTAYGTATVYSSSWSNPTRPSTDGPLYCGYFFDAETSLHQLRIRYYDSTLSALVSRDPLLYEPGDPNLQRYCGNNPAMYVDPNGTNYWDYVTKLNGGHVNKVFGGAAGGVVQLAAWFKNDIFLQAGAQTGFFFYPDTCEIGLFSIKMGIVKALDPNGGPPKINWEGGVQAGLNISIEYAEFTGPGDASATSFAGIFYTGQAAGGTAIGPGISGYMGVPGPNGAYWYGGTLGVGVGLPIQVGTVAWNYQLIASKDMDDGNGPFFDAIGYCDCLFLTLQMP